MTMVLGDIMDHVRLVGRMAKATGTDLVGAYETGVLTQEEWAGIVQTCRGCTWSERCGEWLDGHEAVQCAPSTCLNRHKFKDLKARIDFWAEQGI